MTEAAELYAEHAVTELDTMIELDSPAGPAEPEDVDEIWSWRYMPRPRALLAWRELVDWVEWLRRRYELTEIKGCWYRHGAVVEELWALMAAHKRAYSPGSEASDYREDLTAWHTQWLRPCMSRLTTMSGNAADCDDQQCRAGTVPLPHLSDGVGDWVTADLAGRSEPTPSDEDVPAMDADAMQRAYRAGLAAPVDDDDPDAALRYEDGIWDYDAAADLYRRRPDTGATG